MSDTDTASVSLTDTPSSILVTKTATPTQVQDSGTVTFSVVVANTSAVDTVYIDSLVDSIYGNLNGKGTCTLVDGVDEAPPNSRQILPGESYAVLIPGDGLPDRDGRGHGVRQGRRRCEPSRTTTTRP